MKKTLFAALVAAALGTANAQSVTLGGGLGFDQIGGAGATPAVALLKLAAPGHEPLTGYPLRLRAQAILGLHSTDAAQSAALGTLYVPTFAGPRELDFSAGVEQKHGLLRLEPGLDVGHDSVLGQSDNHGAAQLRARYTLSARVALDCQARAGVASGGQTYAGADIGLRVAGIVNGALALSYANLRDGDLPRQQIISVSYQHALRF